MTAPAYGRAFAHWRSAASGPWQAYTQHAFVRGLGDGSLPNAAFLHYLRQDYLFLIHFSRAWALAAVKSDRFEELQAATATVNALVNHEMQLHVDTCAAQGSTEADLRATPEAPQNMAYTRYVLDAGFSGGFLDLMAALAPCVLGYGEIGAKLAQTATSQAYSSWISVYSGEEYQQVCRDVGALIDDALEHRLGADWPDSPRLTMLTRHFIAATRLEVGFWDMGLAP